MFSWSVCEPDACELPGNYVRSSPGIIAWELCEELTQDD